MAKLKSIQIYTDGSCLGNPGPGGYGIVLKYKQHIKQLSAGFKLTTNNRMELLAPIVALESLKEPCIVDVTSDSQYMRLGITTWIHNWRARNWKTSSNQAVKNKDLWIRLDEATKSHTITWHWVKGHAGHTENEICDELARAAALAPTNIDIGYEG